MKMHTEERSLNCLSSDRPVFTFATLFATLLPQPAVARRGSVAVTASQSPETLWSGNIATTEPRILDLRSIGTGLIIARKQNWLDFSSLRTKLDLLVLR